MRIPLNRTEREDYKMLKLYPTFAAPQVLLVFGFETYTSDRISTRIQRIAIKAATRVQIIK